MDRMADVGGQRWPRSLPLEGDIVGPLFRRSSRCWALTSVQLADVQPNVGCRHCQFCFPKLRLTSATDVGLSVGKLNRQCWRPTLADTG